MSQATSEQTSADRDVTRASAAQGAVPWLLETDRLLLRHLYAQRDEQLEQLAALQQAGGKSKSISIVQSQIAALDHAIRQAEEQAALHVRQAEIRQME